MKRTKIIRINLLTNIAVPDDAKAIEEQRKKEEALMDLCEKLEKQFKDKGKKVEIKIIPYNDIENRKKSKNEILLLIDHEKYDIIENEIGKAIESQGNSFFVRLFDRIKELVIPDKTTTINLFVICPKKSLNKEKEQVSKRCLELNEEYAKTGKKFKINPVTYYDPENREDVSNNYIKDKADLVLFLVDNISDDDDDPLVKNIKLAIDQNKTFQKPEPIVMVSKDSGKNTFETTKKILASGGWIPDPFNSTPELLEKVEDKLDRYINSYRSIRKTRRKSIWRYYSLRIGLPLIFVLAVVSGVLWSKAESRRLLIVGGGSARSYIEDSLLHKNQRRSTLNSWFEGSLFQKKNSLSTLYWLYVAMPSGDSYRIMAEEIIKNYSDYKNRPYYPIVISAQKAPEKAFLRTSSSIQFKERGIIIGIKIGEDWLVAYGNDSTLLKYNNNETFIQAKSLDNLIANQVLSFGTPSDSTVKTTIANFERTTIYTTSENSGTLNSYFSICDSIKLRDFLNACDTSRMGRLIFSDIDTLPKQGFDTNWIAFGSNYYHPKNKKMVQLTVHDSLDHIVTKPIFVYFMMYKYGEKYILPNATEEFLEKIMVDDSIITCIKNIEVTDKILYDNYSTINNHD